MIASAQIGELAVEWTVPPTTADVLEWRVWIACIDSVEAHTEAAFAWASKWVKDPTHLIQLATDYRAFLGLCELIARSAELPLKVLADFQRMSDKQNSIDPAWMPKPPCDCPRCRRTVAENPAGVVCMWDDIDPRAERAASALLGLGDLSDPYYVTQMRAQQKRNEARYSTHEREKREEHADYKERMKRGGGVR